MAEILGIKFRNDLVETFKSFTRFGTIMLACMIVIDAAFVVASFYNDDRGTGGNRLHVSFENGIAERWQYVKWAVLGLLLACMFVKRRSAVYLAWALLFLYFLLDDSQQLHETVGLRIATELNFKPAFGLRARDFGELVVTAIAAVPLFCFLGSAYLLTSQSDAKTFTHDMFALVIVLAFFGVAIDMLDIAVPWSSVQRALSIVEDGGEMIVATLMVAYVIGSFRRTHPNPA